MKSKKLSRAVRYSANDMYNLVSDIESYPYFVPACKSLEVLKKRKDGDIIYIDAIMEVGYGFLNESFNSNVIVAAVFIFISLLMNTKEEFSN